MTTTLHHPGEERSNEARDLIAAYEPVCTRTFTPTQAVLAKSAGVFHWTPEGRRLYDFTSGVLVTNLGHNPSGWMRRFNDYMGWTTENVQGKEPFFAAMPLNAYNAVTPVETEASRRLIALLQGLPGGS